MNIELITENNGILYYPVVLDNIQVDQTLSGSPAKLSFNVEKTPNLNIQHGNPVILKIDEFPMFYGFIFTHSRNKDGTIKYIAYDQTRYLKNKEIVNFENVTATQIIQSIANDFNLQCGNLADTGMKIESYIKQDKTMFEIIQEALDMTLQNKRELYILYDDFGKLTLKNIADMKSNLLIEAQTAEDFDYTASIDNETYNKVKLFYKNEKTGKLDTYVVLDSENVNKWGVLQHLEELKNPENGVAKAESLLKLYNAPTRKLQIKNAFGDVRVRAGSLVPVNLNLGDMIQNSFLFVHQCSHKLKQDEYMMDLTLKGGAFIA